VILISAGQNYLAGQGARSTGGGRNNNLPWYSAQVQQQQGARYAVQHQGGGNRDIGIMMEILPLRGQDISNLGSCSIRGASSMSSTSKTSRRSNKT
jgi:hypothetical protein